MAVLGLSDKGDADWARLRGLQYAALAKLTFHRAYVHALLGLFVAQMYLGAAGPFWVGGWFAALMFVHVRGAMVDRLLADADRRKVTRSEFWQHAATSTLRPTGWRSIRVGNGAGPSA